MSQLVCYSPSMNTDLLTPKEVAALLGVSRATVYNLLSARVLTFRKYGSKTIRIERAEVHRYIALSTRVKNNGNGKPVVDEEGHEIIEWR